MVKETFDLNTIVNDDTKSKMLRGFIKEVMECQIKVNQENEAIKDIRTEAKDKLGLPPKLLNKLVKAVQQDEEAINEEREMLDDLEALVKVVQG